MNARRRPRKKKPKKSRPSTAKYGWNGARQALSTSVSGRPMSASTRKKKKGRKRRNSAKVRAQLRKKTAQQDYMQQLQEEQMR